MKVTMVNRPNNGLPRWMKLANPLTKHEPVLIMKGHFPQYVFEISSTKVDAESVAFEYKDSKVYITVRKDIDHFGPPPERYFFEMCDWYRRSKLRPSINRLNADKVEKVV